MNLTLEEQLALLDFEPKFYIMDKGLCRVMSVEKEDKYEYSGVWFQGGKVPVEDFFQVYPASLGKSSLEEYVSNYDFTNSKETAFTFLADTSHTVPITTEQMHHENQNQDFHY